MNLCHLWRQKRIILSPQRRVYEVSEQAVSLHLSKSRSTHAEYFKHPQKFDQYYLVSENS